MSAKVPFVATTALAVASAVLIAAWSKDGGSADRPPAVLVEFEELFAPVDRIRLDPSVLLGMTVQFDVSSEGTVLVADWTRFEILLYDRAGSYIRTLDAEECAPGAPSPTFARFVFDDQILMATSDSAYLFDAVGNCLDRVDELTPLAHSYCSRDDTLFTYAKSRVPRAMIYRRDFKLIEEIVLPAAKSPHWAAADLGPGAWRISCGPDGTRYLYPGNSDAVSIFGDGTPQYAPVGYREPPALPEGLERADLSKALQNLSRTYHTAQAVFQVDDRFRLVLFGKPSASRPVEQRLLNVIDTETGISYTASSRRGVVAVRNGLVYSLVVHGTDAEVGASGPMLLVYKLTPPR